jgi:hypothetical protein
MSKIFNVYSNDVDRTWYQSSNIKFSECIDHDNQLKTLIVVFNNGTQYRYDKVDVRDYLLFRDAESQGKALNQYIKPKGYAYEKLENADLATLDGELTFRMEGGVFVDYDGEHLKMRNNKDEVILDKETRIDKEALNAVCAALTAIGKDVKLTIPDDFGLTKVDEVKSETEAAEAPAKTTLELMTYEWEDRFSIYFIDQNGVKRGSVIANDDEVDVMQRTLNAANVEWKWGKELSEEEMDELEHK